MMKKHGKNWRSMVRIERPSQESGGETGSAVRNGWAQSELGRTAKDGGAE